MITISVQCRRLSIASLKTEGAAPRYEQIANALCQAIRTGELKPGDRLPTVRQLAADLGVSLTTVTAAFKSLAESGWTRGEIGRGTFVAERGGYESSPLYLRDPDLPNACRWQARQDSVAQAGACQSDREAAFGVSRRDQLQFRRTRSVSIASEDHQAALDVRLRRRHELRPSI